MLAGIVQEETGSKREAYKAPARKALPPNLGRAEPTRDPTATPGGAGRKCRWPVFIRWAGRAPGPPPAGAASAPRVTPLGDVPGQLLLLLGPETESPFVP